MRVETSGQVSLLRQSQEATVTLERSVQEATVTLERSVQERSVQEGLRGRLRLLFDQQNTIIATTTI